jgi:hypothetical protein
MILTRRFCPKCSRITEHHNNKCERCTKADSMAALLHWQALSIEEKLLDLHTRLLRIETSFPL